MGVKIFAVLDVTIVDKSKLQASKKALENQGLTGIFREKIVK